MAIVWRVKRMETHPIMGDYCPPPIEGIVRGQVRLWYEKPSPPNPPGVPLSPSPFYLVIGDDIGPTSGPIEQRYGEAVTVGDQQRMGGWQDLLTARGLSIDDYNANHSFGADLALPASMIDAYVG